MGCGQFKVLLPYTIGDTNCTSVIEMNPAIGSDNCLIDRLIVG